jgi:hypothetical protein
MRTSTCSSMLAIGLVSLLYMYVNGRKYSTGKPLVQLAKQSL